MLVVGCSRVPANRLRREAGGSVASRGGDCGCRIAAGSRGCESAGGEDRQRYQGFATAAVGIAGDWFGFARGGENCLRDACGRLLASAGESVAARGGGRSCARRSRETVACATAAE